MAQAYTKAPITEATIEFRLAEPLSDRDLERLKGRYPKSGWKVEDLADVSVRIGPEIETFKTPIGQKYSSLDGRYIIQHLRKSLAISRNAPYNGWNSFSEEVKKHYKDWRKVVGKKALVRLGVRYINRIDIPFDGKNPIDPAQFFNFKPPSVEGLQDPAAGWQVQLLTRHVKHDLNVTLSSTTVDAALINHVSVSLDLDFYRYQVDVPQSDDQIWALLDHIRESKNEIFEKCITDSTRKLIS